MKVVPLGSTFTFGDESATKTFNHWADVAMIHQPFLVPANRWAADIDYELNAIEAEHK